MTTTEVEDRHARFAMGLAYLLGLAFELFLIALMSYFPEGTRLPVACYLAASIYGFILSVIMLCDPKKFELIGWLWGLAMAFCTAWCLTLACLAVGLSR